MNKAEDNGTKIAHTRSFRTAYALMAANTATDGIYLTFVSCLKLCVKADSS